MTEHTFTVSGDSGIAYLISYSVRGNRTTLICNCPSYKGNNFCKHLISIFVEGDLKRIAQNEQHLCVEIMKQFHASDTYKTIREINSKIYELRTLHESVCRQAVAIKTEIERNKKGLWALIKSIDQ